MASGGAAGVTVEGLTVVPSQILLTAAPGGRGRWSGSALLHLQFRPGDRGPDDRGPDGVTGWPDGWHFRLGQGDGLGPLPPGFQATFVPLSPTAGLVRLRVTRRGLRAGPTGTLCLEFGAIAGPGATSTHAIPWAVVLPYQLLPPTPHPLPYRPLVGILLFFWSATAIATASAPEAAIAILLGFILGMGAGGLMDQHPAPLRLRWPAGHSMLTGFLILVVEGHWQPLPLLLKAIAGGLCGGGVWRELTRLARPGGSTPQTKGAAIAAMVLGGGLGLGCGLSFTHPLALALIIPAALGLLLLSYDGHRRSRP